MSTNKTPNLELNQWVASDPVRMEDFNADNARIDAAVHAAQTAAQTAQAAADANPWVKLLDITTTEAVSTVELNLRDVNLSQYAELHGYLPPPKEGDSNHIRLNNVTNSYYLLPSSGSSENIGTVGSCFTADLGSAYIYVTVVTGSWRCSTVTSKNLTHLTVYRSIGTIPAGSRFVIYGVKRG